MTSTADVRTASRAAVLAQIAEGAADRERLGVDPFEQIGLLRTSGLTALTLDPVYGGDGASIRELLAFVTDLAHADPIVAHILRAHFWQAQQISRLPEGPAKDRWAREVAAGKVFGNATSERSGAAGTLRFATELRAIDGGWLLNGSKFYSTGTAFADYVSVSGRLSEHQVAKVNVPVGRDGVVIEDDWDGIGQHRTGTGSTNFTDVLVTQDDFLQVIDLEERAASVVTDGPLLQLYLQAVIAGVLRSVVDDARALVRRRVRSFDHAPAEIPSADPILLQTIGELASTAYVAQAAVLAAGAEVDRAYSAERTGRADAGELFAAASLAAAQVKVHLDRVGLTAAAAVFDVGGASAASRAVNLDRHWRNIRTLTLHNPTSYKALAIGDLVVNDNPLPGNGYF